MSNIYRLVDAGGGAPRADQYIELLSGGYGKGRRGVRGRRLRCVRFALTGTRALNRPGVPTRGQNPNFLSCGEISPD